MENSFFEYRDATAADSDSDTEIIDNSIAEEESSTVKKHHTVFVAESDEYTEDESNNESKEPQNLSKSIIKRSNAATNHVISSSDDDVSNQGSIRRHSESSSKLVVSSSEEDDEQYSPEMVRRKQPVKKKSLDTNESIIGRKTKKRMIFLDSDTENSIIIEHDKHKKLQCLKDTPLKIPTVTKPVDNDTDNMDSDVASSASDQEDNELKSTDSDDDVDKNKTESTVEYEVDNLVVNKTGDVEPLHYGSPDHSKEASSDYDELDEDQMVMSRATRMSIMGVIPKDNDDDTDDSDFIQSDNSRPVSQLSVGSSLPDIFPPKTPEKPPTQVEDLEEESDSSRLSCSPFSSPFRDVTNEIEPRRKSNMKDNDKREIQDDCVIISDTGKNAPSGVGNKVLNNKKENYIRYDDDVTIIDTKEEIIALSSDDDDEVTRVSKSPKLEKFPKLKNDRPGPISQNIKQYLAPPSYPNQQVIYVKKHVRESELLKLNALQEDLKNIRYLLEEMDVDTLPDGGGKLIERLTHLEEQVRLQGDKVANMVVEPDNPTAADIARDGFDKKEGLTWDDIQKASNAVQPRMFGKQAMATHMAERNLILDRLRDLYESLASRPADSQQATAPQAMSSTLLPHQLHALAWLRWRETQRPRAGILADDMGLGKTITMIALIVGDKENKIDHDDDDDDDDDYPTKSKTVARGGTLVVCPASLMQQWGGEVSKHCRAHALSVCLHHGPARAHQPHRLATYDLVCTTYNILQRDNEKTGVLMRVRWRRVVLDEAHAVRNHKSATCSAVCALRAARRWCLTGTPVQNKDLDLFALLKFLKCSPFDDLTMWKKWIDNKSLGGQERMSTIMQCLLLRRTKKQLQQKGQLDCLPERTAHQKHVTLSQAEMNVYQKVLVFSKTLFAQFLHQRAEKTADAEGFTSSKDSAYAKMHKKMIALQGAKPVKSHEILVLLLRLRQVCCHCGLIASMLDEESAADVAEDPAGQDLLAELNKLSLEDSRSKRRSKNKSDDEEEPDGPAQEGTTAAEAIRSVLSPNNPVFELSRLSSKISAVMDCLRNDVFVNKGDKAVVVSQWTSVLRLVEAELKKARVRCVTLSGNVPVPARPPLITALNDPQSDVKVMLLSLCAGGVGLNLCGANHLLLLDPHWNPQLEEQAQDRIYRVGQKKNVHIYRFMCLDTVEQSIRKLQEAKLELAENVLTGAKNTNKSKLTIEDLKMLFNMGE